MWKKNGFPTCMFCFKTSNALELCGKCNQTLGIQRFSAEGKKYHKECFICEQCKSSLENGFKEKDGQLLCEKCLKSLTLQKEVCAGCQKPLGEARFSALDRKWHQECFVCLQCKKPIESLFYQKDGQPQCEKCRNQTLQTQPQDLCGRCDKIIEGKRFSAMGKKWHPTCFVCNTCQSPLEDFMESQGQPYCGNCFKLVIKSPTASSQSSTSPKSGSPSSKSSSPASVPNQDEICGGCSKLLGNGKRVSALGKKWHKECFICSACQKDLGGGFWEKNGMPHCGCLDAYYCGGCTKLIQGKILTALGKKWHSDCFVCTKCKTGLTSGFWPSKLQEPFCQNCFKLIPKD